MELQNIRVINHRSSLVVLPGVPGKRSVRLLPGGNNVPAEYVSAVVGSPKTNRIWQNMIGAQVISVMDAARSSVEVKKPEGPEPPRSLADTKIAGAIAFVDVEGSEHVLRGWLSNEKRKGVRDALRRRLSSIGESITIDQAADSDDDDTIGDDEDDR